MDKLDTLPLALPVEGREWILSETGIEPEQLQKIYEGPTSCYVRPNSTNEENGNIFTSGTIVGFLSAFDYTKLKAIQAQFEFPLEFIMQTPQWHTRDLPILLINKAKPKKSQKRHPRSVLKDKKAFPITERQNSKQKHPISKIAFAPKRNLEAFFKKNNYKTGIYCIYSNDFATYIGQARDIGKRLRQHVTSLNKSKHHNYGLQHAWNTKGASKFTFFVIEQCEEDELDDLERIYIQKYKTYEFGYNSTSDGQGNVPSEYPVKGSSPSGIYCSDEAKNAPEVSLQLAAEGRSQVLFGFETRDTSAIDNAVVEDVVKTEKLYASNSIEPKKIISDFDDRELASREASRRNRISENYESRASISSRHSPQHLTKEIIAEKVRLINLEKARTIVRKTPENKGAGVGSGKSTKKNSITKVRLEAVLIDIESNLKSSSQKFLASVRNLKLVQKLKIDGLILCKVRERVCEFSERLDRSAVHLSKIEKQDFEERLLKIKQALKI